MSAPLWMQAVGAAGGGAIGSLLRFGCSHVLAAQGWSHWPFSTLLVNVSGCAAIGVCARYMQAAADGGHGGMFRAFVMYGVLGGLTTFSALGIEVYGPLQSGRPWHALGILAANLVLGLGAVAVGWSVGRMFLA
ncbi:MAG: CrcB family protein [Phycisphaeraceae bacterium]|nr:CrcB family protein [Phycisphaeraceae bacterium]